MMESVCDQVAERVALGEPFGDLAEHAEGCTRCQNLVAMTSKLGATHHKVDPGLGFTARMTVGAQHRLAARRRQRLAAGLAATVVSGAIGVFVVTHTPEEGPAVAVPYVSNIPDDKAAAEEDAAPTAPDDDDLAALAQFADVERTSRLSADWKRITKPLAAYKRVVNEAPDEETP